MDELNFDAEVPINWCLKGELYFKLAVKLRILAIFVYYLK
jgi:hypothetical protein